MTELELLRELGDQTPLPELTELTDARARLMREISSERATLPPSPAPRSGRTRRPRRRRVVAAIVSVGGAGAALLAVIFGANAHPGVSHGRSIANVPPPRLPRLADPTASQVLQRAAFVALHTATATPSGDQFVYTKTESQGHTIQVWMSVDGTHTSRVGTSSRPGCVNGQMSLRMLGEDGKPLSDFIPKQFRGRPLTKAQAATLFGGKIPYDGPVVTRSCTPQTAYFPDMPTQADGMLPYLQRTQGVRSDDLNDIAKTVGGLLDSDYLLPAQQAALYAFLGRTPGITIQRAVTDAAGRPGVGVAWSFDGSQAMLIFDPQTYTYLGMTTRGIGGQISGTALLATAIVDNVGQAPGPSTTPASTAGA
jgi:hypothetical protein